MNRGNVSFTFLDRVKEVELNIEDGRWQSALALALTLPDICGGIAFPDIVKRYRDGRIMFDRQKNPTRDVGAQYIRWFDEYAGDFFKISPEDAAPYICGERCWQLRCEYLHQNKGFLNDKNQSNVRFHLGINCGTSVCQTEKSSYLPGDSDIRIDIEQFCIRMCRATRSYYDAANKEKDFSLYNTPVLDFIQVRQGTRTNPLIAVLCKSQTYANGIRLSLKQISEQVLVFNTPEEARKTLGKRKPVIWIVADETVKKKAPSWKESGNRPVILLTKYTSKISLAEENKGKLRTLKLPVMPEDLRNAVNACLR